MNNHDMLEQAYQRVLQTQAVMQEAQAAVLQGLILMQRSIQQSTLENNERSAEMQKKFVEMDKKYDTIILMLEKLPDEVKRKIGFISAKKT